MTKRLLMFLAWLLSCWQASGALAAEGGDVYQLRAGDAVLVSVWKEDALQKEVRVLPDGSITFPLVGRVEVGGLSTPEVEQRIAVKLKQYIPEPTVTVVITGIEGNRAFVIGKVLKPGPMTMTGPTTVLQALSMAGGLDKFANEGAIKVIRTHASVQEIMAVNYKDLINGNMTTNYQLKVGDTVLVP